MSNQQYVSPDRMSWVGLHPTPVTFLPEVHTLNLVMRKQPTNLSGGTVYTITGLYSSKISISGEGKTQETVPDQRRLKLSLWSDDWIQILDCFCYKRQLANINKVCRLDDSIVSVLIAWFWSLFCGPAREFMVLGNTNKYLGSKKVIISATYTYMDKRETFAWWNCPKSWLWWWLHEHMCLSNVIKLKCMNLIVWNHTSINKADFFKNAVYFGIVWHCFLQ